MVGIYLKAHNPVKTNEHKKEIDNFHLPAMVVRVVTEKANNNTETPLNHIFDYCSV